MENIRFDFSNFHRHGTAFYDFLALRKQVFVDDLGWDIPHDENVEMDQYDTPIAQYSLVLKDGKVVGGARGMAPRRCGESTPTCCATPIPASFRTFPHM